MFEDELKAVNKQIDEWEAKIADGIEDVLDGFMDSLYAMKKSLEKQMQKYQMEKELNERFEHHIESNRERFRKEGHKISGTFLSEKLHLRREVAKNYEAASSERVEENFQKTMHEVWRLNEGFDLIVSTCTKRGFF